jgi:hypothetical protein
MARRRDDPPRGNMSSAPSIEGTSAIAVATAPEPLTTVAPIAQPAELSLPKIQTATLTAMERTNQKIVANWLELGEWKTEGAEIVVAVAAKQPMIDAALKGEAQRALNQAATEVSGQTVRVRVVASSKGNGNAAPAIARAVGDGNDAKSRALNDPLVKKMKDKFGGEIRTVIDQRKK